MRHLFFLHQLEHEPIINHLANDFQLAFELLFFLCVEIDNEMLKNLERNPIFFCTCPMIC
jgi:hypothetical protein